jgi:hypothetical protein
MIILKNFTDFKNIINDTEKRKLLLRGTSWWQRYRLWIYSNEQVIVENDKIIIPFVSGKYNYNAVFVRNIDTNEILIQNSTIGSIWWYFLNRYISKRILKNWEKC